jgi:hypothetical protein
MTNRFAEDVDGFDQLCQRSITCVITNLSQHVILLITLSLLYWRSCNFHSFSDCWSSENAPGLTHSVSTHFSCRRRIRWWKRPCIRFLDLGEMGNHCYSDSWWECYSAHWNGLQAKYVFFFIIDTFVSLAIPSLQLGLTTSLFYNLDSKLKTNSQYLSIDQCRVLVLICSHTILRSCLAQIPLALCSAFNTDHYAHWHSSNGLVLLSRRVASL